MIIESIVVGGILGLIGVVCEETQRSKPRPKPEFKESPVERWVCALIALAITDALVLGIVGACVYLALFLWDFSFWPLPQIGSTILAAFAIMVFSVTVYENKSCVTELKRINIKR